MATLFTRIIQGEIPCHRIVEDDRYLAFLDIMPLVTGHVLVVPKVEVDWVFDLETEDLSGLLVFARPVARAVQQAIPCKRVGVSVIGLEVPHAHVHLLPMHSVADMNFERPKLQPSQEELAEVAARIRAAM
jgi:histidine triad (HIT) family protein